MDLPTHTAPDVPPDPAHGSCRGYAWWRIDDGGWLETHPGFRWTSGWNEASCRLYPRFLRGRWRRLHPAGVPGTFCLCGFHGSSRPQPAGPGPRLAARIHSGTAGMLFGVAEGAGPMITDARGWRARFARPIALYVSPERFAEDRDRIGAVAARYRVPILRSFDALTAVWGPGATEEPSFRTA
jgi:hypothetical protein